jgi:hypothetical protein
MKQCYMLQNTVVKGTHITEALTSNGSYQYANMAPCFP